MVAGQVTGAEGDEQTGRELPDLQLWPEFGIPAQRAEETSVVTGPDGGEPAEGASAAAEDADENAAPGVTAGIPAQPSGPRTGTTAATGMSGTAGTAGTAGPRPPRTPRQIETDPTLIANMPDTPETPGAPNAPALPAQPLSSPLESVLAPQGEQVPGPGPGLASEVEPSPLESGPVLAPRVEALAAVPEAEAAGRDGSGDAAGPRKLRSDRHSHRSRMRRQTANGVVVLACLAVTFLVLHRFLPDVGGVGSLLETWLPWFGVPLVVLLIAAAIVHTKTSLIVTVAAALVWTALYGPQLLPRGSSAPAQLRIFSEDVNGNAKEATASGTMALAQHADIVALEDMYSSVYESSAVNSLNAAYVYHDTEYEFGLWSAYPISHVQPVALGTTQSAQPLALNADDAGLAASASDVPVIGALKATLATPSGPLTVYLVHLPQPVLGDQGFAKSRDQALTQFVKLLNADRSARIAVIGDINVAATDRQFSQLTRTDGLTSAQQAAGSGYGFTWPAEFPFVRLDDVLTRGLTPLRSVVLPSIAKGQTHLPIQVDLNY